MTDVLRASADVAGRRVDLLELDAIHAPLGWIVPDAPAEERAWLPCHVLLCRRPGETVLVDCGLGAAFEDVFELPVRRTGLAEALASVGATVDEIRTVVLTHFDADHACGILAGTRPDALVPALPHARVVHLDVASADAGELAPTILDVLRAGGVEVAALPDGAEVGPGMRLRAAPGHRGGHARVELDGFVFLADALHARDHVPRPEDDWMHDSDPELALATRRAVIDELAGTGTIVGCSHVDGFGRIERAADGSAVWVDLA